MATEIGFIGAGQMASAMIKGVLAKGLYGKDEILACAPSPSTRQRVSSEYGIKVCETAAEVARSCKLVVLAVKPKQIPEVFAEEGFEMGADHILVSIAAGVTIKALESYVPDSKIVRVMPNHCCMVLEGAAGYTRGTKATDADVNKVKAVLEATGLAFEVKEGDLDAITGLAGSSPAYMYMVIDAMADGGVLCGLPRDVAIRLAAQSMLGAAKTVLETGKHPDALRDGVCSPGGTTIEGVRTLEDLGLRSAFIAAVEAGTEKSKAMSRGR